MFDEKLSANYQEKIMEPIPVNMREGGWFWWFWLFFIENPEDPDRPRQLMILWSTKQDKAIICNDVEMVLDHSIRKDTGGMKSDGAVAAWFFDGERMHHNFVLEQCLLEIEKNTLYSRSKTPTSFWADKDRYSVKIGKDIEFNMKLADKNEFSMPNLHHNEYLKGKFSYTILKMNKLALDGKLNGEKIKGSAYFQKVYVNAPSPPWYWGIFHFDDGSILTYFRPNLGRLLREKAIKKEITFFHNGKLHALKDIKIKKERTKDYPIFHVSGQDERVEISFEVHTYTHSSWVFRKRMFGKGPKTKLDYGEYPAIIENFVMTDKKSGLSIDQSALGRGVGNAEHTRGILF